MKKKLKVGLYDPYLDILGGGEKHILSIMQIFSEKDAEINIFWDKDLSQEIKKRFFLPNLKKIKWLPNIFKNKSPLKSLKNLNILRSFDYFFYVTDGSYFFSLAKKNFAFAMVPDKHLYNISGGNRFKLKNWKFIANSPFTNKWLRSWNIDSITIPPFVESPTQENAKKKKMILSVGRFFGHLHSKKHEEIIDTFIKLKKSSPSFKDYQLILAGGLKDEDRDYFDKLQSFVKNKPDISLKKNVGLSELQSLYKDSSYYWHFTGLGVNENHHPEEVEHFGIAPLEAMISGAITFCYNAGGPKYFIRNNENGFLFENTEQLITTMNKLENDEKAKEKIRKKAKGTVRKDFSYEVFEKKVLELMK